jgi:hypothetical protein
MKPNSHPFLGGYMQNSLVSGLREIIVDLKEDEAIAKHSGNSELRSALLLARVKLELLLEQNGHQRPADIPVNAGISATVIESKF